MIKKSFLRKIKSNLSIWLNIPVLYTKQSFSQEGEDLILLKLFNYKREGFYVDVGAHHPYRYSNTYLLHKRGWKGINIDSDINAIKLFEKSRPNDTNIKAAISNRKKKLKMYVFEDTALNTISKSQSKKVQESKQSKLVRTKEIRTRCLKEVLSQHLPQKISIDLLNIDVEGLDYEVLKSNDWKKYKPKVICVEILPEKSNRKSAIEKLLNKHCYRLVAKTINSSLFKLV